MTKKVLRIITRLNIGGPAIHVTNLNYYLDKDYDYKSVLVYGSLADGEGSMEYLLQQKELKAILLPELGREISLKNDLKTIWELYKIIKREKPDIVHTHTAKAGLAGRVAARLAGVKQIYHTFHGHVFHSYFGSLKTKLFIIIEKTLAFFTEKIVVISEKQKQELLAYGIAPEKKLEVIPLGFELDKLLAVPEQNFIRKKYNFSIKDKLVGIVGRLVPIKNHEYFLEIASKVITVRDDVKFLIIGDGDKRAELQRKISELGLTDNVIITGFISPAGNIYPDLDIVVLTSFNEGTPVTLIEALAFAKPVLATDVGGVSDVLQAGRNGCLELLNDSSKFSIDLLAALDNSEELRKKAQQGSEYIKQYYSIERLTGNINSLYK
jgi:glycosyltransferase involved in cell wall biosynthesis